MKKNKVVFDNLVERDKKIIELVEKIGVATREQVHKVLFKNVHPNVTMRRLSFLTDNKLIKRDYYQIDSHKNVYVYFLGKKPAKRNIKHEVLVSEFLTNVMTIAEIVEVQTHYKLGNIISDAYIRYKDSNDKVKSLFLEVQLSNKVSDCTEKYKNIRTTILEERPDWQVIPRLIVITDLEHENEQIRNMKVKYDNTKMNNLRELLF